MQVARAAIQLGHGSIGESMLRYLKKSLLSLLDVVLVQVTHPYLLSNMPGPCGTADEMETSSQVRNLSYLLKTDY